MERFDPSSREVNSPNPPASEDLQFVRPIKVRCPDCFKLYSVNPQEIAEARPKFQCTSCESRFWISYPEALEQEEIIGFPLEWIEKGDDVNAESQSAAAPSAAQVEVSHQTVAEGEMAGIDPTGVQGSGSVASDDEASGGVVLRGSAEVPSLASKLEQEPTRRSPAQGDTGQDFLEGPLEDSLKEAPDDLPIKAEFHCPNCGASYRAGDKECGHCGIVFRKFETLQELGVSVPASEELKLSWEKVIGDYDSRDRHNAFVRACMLDDNLPYAGQQYRRILEANPHDELAQEGQNKVIGLTMAQAQPQNVGKPRKWRRLNLTSVIFVVSGMLIAAGFILPSFRNLVGIGAAVLFFALALRFYFK